MAQSHKGGSARRVAALADVHGNAPALEAVLAEVELAEPDLIVFCGDLTWGSLPRETLALVVEQIVELMLEPPPREDAIGTQST